MNENGQATQGQAENNPAPYLSDSTTMDAFTNEDMGWVKFDEQTGRIILRGEESSTSPPPAKSGIADQNMMDTNTKDGGYQQQQQTPQPNQEVTALQNQVNGLIQVVQNIAAYLDGSRQNGQPTNPQNSEPDYDIETQAGMKQFIVDTVRAAVGQTTKPLTDALPHIVNRLSYQDSLMNHGKPFEEALPAIKAVMESDANLTFEQAFKIVQTVKGLTSAGQHSTPTQTPKQQGPVEDLMKKAQQLGNNAQGVNNGVKQPQQQFSSLRECLDNALATEMGG